MRKLATTIGVFMFSGCASIVSKSQYPVTITSHPDRAEFTVINKKGTAIHKSKTPSTITLPANTGFFNPARYSIEFEADGYCPGFTTLSAELDGWYIGNVIFGGLLGWLIIDPATGAMWRLDDTVFGVLSPDSDSNIPVAKPEDFEITEVVFRRHGAVQATGRYKTWKWTTKVTNLTDHPYAVRIALTMYGKKDEVVLETTTEYQAIPAHGTCEFRDYRLGSLPHKDEPKYKAVVEPYPRASSSESL